MSSVALSVAPDVTPCVVPCMAPFRNRSTAMPSADSARRPAAALLVLALHLAWLTAWWDHRTTLRDTGEAAPGPGIAWLRRMPGADAPPEPVEPIDRTPQPPRRQARAEPQAIRPPQTLPDEPPAGPALTDAAQERLRPDANGGPEPAGGPAPRPAWAVPRPLDLRLPPPELRGPAPPGPRTAPAASSVESTIARGLSPGPMVEEDLGQGRRRFRQGTRCIEAREARMAQIDPFNQSVAAIPKALEDCAR